MEFIKAEFKKIGYKFCQETKTYIEFRTNEYGIWDRIKVSKKDYSITKDCTTGAGNRGRRNIEYNEFLLIIKLINLLKEN